MPSRNYLIRQMDALLRLARETKDPQRAATMLDKAATFSARLDDQSLREIDASPKAPDVVDDVASP